MITLKNGILVQETRNFEFRTRRAVCIRRCTRRYLINKNWRELVPGVNGAKFKFCSLYSTTSLCFCDSNINSEELSFRLGSLTRSTTTGDGFSTLKKLKHILLLLKISKYKFIIQRRLKIFHAEYKSLLLRTALFLELRDLFFTQLIANLKFIHAVQDLKNSVFVQETANLRFWTRRAECDRRIWREI